MTEPRMLSFDEQSCSTLKAGFDHDVSVQSTHMMVECNLITIKNTYIFRSVCCNLTPPTSSYQTTATLRECFDEWPVEDPNRRPNSPLKTSSIAPSVPSTRLLTGTSRPLSCSWCISAERRCNAWVPNHAGGPPHLREALHICKRPYTFARGLPHMRGPPHHHHGCLSGEVGNLDLERFHQFPSHSTCCSEIY